MGFHLYLEYTADTCLPALLRLPLLLLRLIGNVTCHPILPICARLKRSAPLLPRERDPAKLIADTNHAWLRKDTLLEAYSGENFVANLHGLELCPTARCIQWGVVTVDLEEK